MAKSRKQRERDAERFAEGIAGLALLAGVYAWAKTRSMGAGLATLILALAFACALVWIRSNARLRRRSRLTLEEIDSGTWEQFESYLLALFHVQGYKAELTPNGADFGADLTLNRGGERTVVQAKHWRTRQVGVKAVQEIAAAKAHYKATRAMVIITGTFTAAAIQLARENAVELWDRERLASVIDSLKSQEPTVYVAAATSADDPHPAPKAPPVMAAAPQVAPVSVAGPQAASVMGAAPQVADAVAMPVASLTDPTCPLCMSPMIRRSSSYGEFWGCSQFPKCRGKRS